MTLLLGAELPDRRMRGRAAEPTIRTFVRTRRVLSDSLCAGPRGHRGLVNGTAGVLRGAGGESREGAEWSVRGEERCGVCGGSGPVGSLGDRDSAYDGGAGARFAPDIQRAADRVQPVGHALQACPVCLPAGSSRRRRRLVRGLRSAGPGRVADPYGDLIEEIMAPVAGVVLTVPAHPGDRHRHRTRSAGSAHGPSPGGTNLVVELLSCRGVPGAGEQQRNCACSARAHAKGRSSIPWPRTRLVPRRETPSRSPT
jgi:hypothetical protein